MKKKILQEQSPQERLRIHTQKIRCAEKEQEGWSWNPATNKCEKVEKNPCAKVDVTIRHFSVTKKIVDGVSYLKATVLGMSESTLFRYIHYYIGKSKFLFQQMKTTLLEWLPGYCYEQDPRIQEKSASKQCALKNSLIFSETIIQAALSKKSNQKWNRMSLINFILTS